MSDATFLYLVTRGRTSGLPRRIEIWFVEHDGRFYVVAEQRERAQWVRNLRADAAVQFSVGTRTNPEASRALAGAHARVPEARSEYALLREVRARMDAKYDWSDGLVVEIAPSP